MASDSVGAVIRPTWDSTGLQRVAAPAPNSTEEPASMLKEGWSVGIPNGQHGLRSTSQPRHPTALNSVPVSCESTAVRFASGLI